VLPSVSRLDPESVVVSATAWPRIWLWLGLEDTAMTLADRKTVYPRWGVAAVFFILEGMGRSGCGVRSWTGASSSGFT
jgi:hypothetical protein